jgi:hypothetical protein
MFSEHVYSDDGLVKVWIGRLYNFIIQMFLKINIKKQMLYRIGNPGPDLGNAQKCGWLMESQPSFS